MNFHELSHKAIFLTLILSGWQLDKTINAMYRKLQKNMTAEELLPSLWEKCKVCSLHNGKQWNNRGAIVISLVRHRRWCTSQCLIFVLLSQICLIKEMPCKFDWSKGNNLIIFLAWCVVSCRKSFLINMQHSLSWFQKYILMKRWHLWMKWGIF